jgi:NADPH:quinone reductase-like Zn-dependent oxidoreductase
MLRRHGGPEVLQVEEIPIPSPKAKEVLNKKHVIGVNFVDAQHRAGLYCPVDLALIPGTQAAGTVEAVGAEASELKMGERVAFAGYKGDIMPSILWCRKINWCPCRTASRSSWQRRINRQVRQSAG